MTFYSKEQKRKLIIDAYSKPSHKKYLDNYDVFISSKLCLDKLKLKSQFQENKFIDISFDANGCALFLASCEIVINEILQKPIKYVKKFLIQYNDSINNKNYDRDILGKAQIFDNVKKHSNRLECVQLIYKGINQLLKNIK